MHHYHRKPLQNLYLALLIPLNVYYFWLSFIYVFTDDYSQDHYSGKMYLYGMVFLMAVGFMIVLGHVYSHLEGFACHLWPWHAFFTTFISVQIILRVALFNGLDMDKLPSIFWCVVMSLCIAVTFLLYFVFGRQSLDDVKEEGPFKVGYKALHSEHDSLRVAVWYPMDKHRYHQQFKPSQAVDYEVYGREYRVSKSHVLAFISKMGSAAEDKEIVVKPSKVESRGQRGL